MGNLEERKKERVHRPPPPPPKKKKLASCRIEDSTWHASKQANNYSSKEQLK